MRCRLVSAVDLTATLLLAAGVLVPEGLLDIVLVNATLPSRRLETTMPVPFVQVDKVTLAFVNRRSLH